MPTPHRIRLCLFQFHLSHHQCQPAYRYSYPFASTYNFTASFSTTTATSQASSHEPTYYEVLEVSVTATPAEIKKQFYSLSLRHHPDRNRDDPTASTRFARISSAYHVLSNAAKRATYDRDHGIHATHHPFSSTHSSANPGQHPMGSYSSRSHNGGASYFGSRPASGLSKRRGTFRGPPPSFYAHGGYGKNTRRKPPQPPNGSTSTGAAGGSGAGSREDDPASFIDRNPVSHFNARGHYKTQSAEDARRAERRTREMGASINDQYIGGKGDFAIRFIVVCGILIGAGSLTDFFRWPNSDRNTKTTKPTRRKDD